MNNWSGRCSPTCSLSRFNFAVSKSFPQANVFHQAFSTDGTVSVLCGLANQDSGVPVLDENKFVCACWRPKRSAGVWMEVTLVSTQRLKSCLLRQHFVTCCVSMKENEHLTPIFIFLKGIPPKGQRYIWPLIWSQSSSSCVIFVNEIWAFCFTGGNFLLHVGAQIAALVVRWCQANANSGWRCLSVQSSSSAVSLLERYLMPSPSVLMEVSSRKCLVNLWISSWVVSACCFLTDQIMWAELGEDERGGNGTCKQRLM